MKDQAYWDRVDAATVQVRVLLGMPLHLLQRLDGGGPALGFEAVAIQIALTLRNVRFR